MPSGCVGSAAAATASNSRRASEKSCFWYGYAGSVGLLASRLARNACCSLAGQLTKLNRRMPRAARAIRASSAAWWAMASVATIFFVEPLVQRLALHPRIGLLRQSRRQLVGGTGDFVAELEEVGDAVRIHRAVLDRRAHRAAGLLEVLAVVELALR